MPWKAVLTSPPFLAIVVAHTCSNWGWYMLLIELPFYMKQVLKFNITEVCIIRNKYIYNEITIVLFVFNFVF